MDRVIMMGPVTYGVDSMKLTKLGEATLTADTFSIKQVSQTTQIVCVIGGVAVAIIISTILFGTSSGGVFIAALRGGITGMIGAVAGILVAKVFPKRYKGIDFSASISDIEHVGDARVGVNRAVEIRTNRGTCIISARNRGEWKQALKKATNE